jgi:hypothetical protein
MKQEYLKATVEERDKEYLQAFARILTSEDKALLKQVKVDVDTEPTVEERFRKLADEWSRETRAVSSVSVLVSHPKYQEIIRLGWKVVPILLHDLQNEGDFWFPALAEITGVRPFDRSDAGKSKKMTAAWITWGKRKGII